MFVGDVAEGCILKCIDEECFFEFFGKFGPEIGQVDRFSEKKFANCARENVKKASK